MCWISKARHWQKTKWKITSSHTHTESERNSKAISSCMFSMRSNILYTLRMKGEHKISFLRHPFPLSPSCTPRSIDQNKVCLFTRCCLCINSFCVYFFVCVFIFIFTLFGICCCLLSCSLHHLCINRICELHGEWWCFCCLVHRKVSHFVRKKNAHKDNLTVWCKKYFIENGLKWREKPRKWERMRGWSIWAHQKCVTIRFTRQK